MSIEQLAQEYCDDSPPLGQIIEREGQRGILFTGPDATDPHGDFIPFSELGYNSDIGFFRKSQFPQEHSDYE